MGEKITAYQCGNIYLKISDLKDIVNTLTVTHISYTLKLRYNLLSTILIAKKNIKVFLRKTSQHFEIIIDINIFGLVNIIEIQFVIRLLENLKPAIVK